jgi:hypothetical protein
VRPFHRSQMKRIAPSPIFPAKAGIQIHPGPLVGFTWAPAFAGETGKYRGSIA